jgi:hypothetical protein
VKPNKCVVLGIDSGKNSGWGLFEIDKWIDAGAVKTHADRKAVYCQAVKLSRESNFPLIIGREIWTTGWDPKKRSFKSIVGLGASWGRWEPIFEEAGFPKGRIFTVDPNKWRQKTLSLRRGKYTRDQANEYAVSSCIGRGWYSGDPLLITHDQAAGTFIAYYMTLDPRVAKAIKNPGRLRKLDL